MSYRKQLDALVKANTITPEAREWLTASFDPFHDQEHALAGYPDNDSSNTVVSCFQYQYDVVNPGGTDPWNCHVYSLPICKSVGLHNLHHEEGQNGFNLSDGLARLLGCNVGFLNVTTYKGAGNSSPFNGPPIVQAVIPGAGVNELCSGNSRIIAAGFEVINATADLYKQGTATVYRQPTGFNQHSVQVNNVAATPYIQQRSGTLISAPPVNEAAALTLRGTRTWPAADGVYAPIGFQSVSNPLKSESCQYLFFDSDYSEELPHRYMMCTNEYDRSTSSLSVPSNKTCPMNITGAFLTGLHPNTTLTIKLRVYVEKAPPCTNPQLAVLATPSAPYDAAALEIYSRVLAQLPVAVDFGSNGAGDWWRAIMRVVSTVATPLAPIIGIKNPLAGAILGGVASVAAASSHKSSPAPEASRSVVKVIPQRRKNILKQKRK